MVASGHRDDQIAAFFRGLTEPGSHTRAAAAGDLMSSRGCVYFQISCRGDMVGDGSNQSQKKKSLAEVLLQRRGPT